VSHRRQNDYHAIAAADCAAGAQLSARESLILHELRTTIRATIAAIDCVAHNYPRASLSFCLRDSLFLPLPKYPQKNGTGNSAKKAAPKKPQKNGTGNLPKKPAKIKNRNFAK
jgi:hypothetical protein